jgi:hypothetical protein
MGTLPWALVRTQGLAGLWSKRERELHNRVRHASAQQDFEGHAGVDLG